MANPLNPGHAAKRKGVRRPRFRNGYIEEWCSDRRRYVYQHRLVMERRLGRHLEPAEIVHHINGDKLDNHASPADQDLLAAELYRRQGNRPWGGRC